MGKISTVLNIITVNSICLIFDFMRIQHISLLFGLITYNSFCYGQQNKGDSLESNTFFEYKFVASTSKSNPLRSTYELSFDNQPRKVKDKFSQSGFFLLLDTQHVIQNKEGILCHQLFLVNNSDSVMSFPYLSFEPEILDNKGKWIPIVKKNIPEFLNFSNSDNCSYYPYQIYLSPKEYWTFNVPVFKGVTKTKLRYRYFYHNVYSGFTSNTIDAYINQDTLNNNEINKTSIQSQYHNASDFEKSTHSIISLDKMNVIYKGLNNPITVDLIDATTQNIYLKLSCGRAIKDSLRTHSYYILLDSAYAGERELSIEIFTKNGRDSSESRGIHHYRIRNIPKPTPMLGSIVESGPCPLGVIKSASFVFANLMNFPYEGVKYTVIYYCVSWQKTTGETLVFESEDNKITSDIKRAFAFAKSGDIFKLYNIKTIGPNGLEKITNELVITIR